MRIYSNDKVSTIYFIFRSLFYSSIFLQGEAVDEATIKKHILSFEKKVTKNQEMRIKFVDQPNRFMESELELHEEIQKLHVLATVPEYYDIFVRLNSVATCLNLMNHENSGKTLLLCKHSCIRCSNCQ